MRLAFVSALLLTLTLTTYAQKLNVDPSHPYSASEQKQAEKLYKKSLRQQEKAAKKNEKAQKKTWKKQQKEANKVNKVRQQQIEQTNHH